MKLERAIEVLHVVKEGGTLPTDDFQPAINLAIEALIRIKSQREYKELATLFPSTTQKLLPGEDKE